MVWLNLAVAALVLTLSACVKSSGSSDPAPAKGGETGDATGGGATLKYNVSNICGLLSKAEAEGLLEKPLIKEPEAEQQTTPQAPVGCMYTTSNTSGMGIRYVQVLLYQPHDTFKPTDFYTKARDGHEAALGSKPEKVAGLGDDAYHTVNTLNILVKGYMLTLHVGSLGEYQKDKTQALALVIIPRL